MSKVEEKVNKLGLYEILDLFSLNIHFNLEDMKKAKKKVLMLHPDKSNISVETFLYYKYAYDKLILIYHFVKNEKDEDSLKKSHDTDDAFLKYLNQKNITSEKNNKSFLNEFNKMFENVYVSDNNEKDGYKDWLKSNDDIYDKDNLEKSRKKLIDNNQISIKMEVGEYNNSLDNDTYTCDDPFSKFKYFDVKDAHKNTIIGMDQEKTLSETKMFGSVDEYVKYQEQNKTTPLNEEESDIYFKNRDKRDNQSAKELAFEYMKQSETIKKRQNIYNSKFLQLTR